MTRITARVRIYFDSVLAVGPGRIELLEGIERTGSLSQAARDMGMSYRRAWLLIQNLNDSLSNPASLAIRGGHRGGGAVVTPTGRALIRIYRRTEAGVARNINQRFARFARARAGSSRSKAPARAIPRN